MAISTTEKTAFGVFAALLLGGGIWWFWRGSAKADAPADDDAGLLPEPDPKQLPGPADPVDTGPSCSYGRKYLAVVAYNTQTPPASYARVQVDENMTFVHPRTQNKFFQSAADAAEAGQQYAYQLEPPQPGEFVRVYTVQAAIGTAWTKCKFNYDLVDTVKG